MNEIRILEVGPRDGLQNEPTILSLKDKIELVEKLASTGLDRIELGSFVSPKWVPQMRDTTALVQQILKKQELEVIPKQIQFSALVPNLKGLHRALESGIKEISVFLSATNSFAKKNINCSAEESYKIYQKVCRQGFKRKFKNSSLSKCLFFTALTRGSLYFTNAAMGEKDRRPWCL